MSRLSRYQFELATTADDSELRQLLSVTPMDGNVSVSFRREPSYFEAAVVEGGFQQVIVCRDREANRIAGFGSRSVRARYVNGRSAPIGYLGNLRALPRYRNLGLVARGYAFLKQLHADGRAKLYLTSIAQGNARAQSILTSGRAGLPSYSFAGNYHTMAIPMLRRFRHRNHLQRSIEVRAATNDDLPMVLGFLNAIGPGRQFFPHYQAEEFSRPHSTFKDLRPSDLLLAFRNSRLVGALAGWDQSRFRQSVVEDYAPGLRRARPLYNLWAGIRGMPKLPKPGERIHYLVGALPIVQDYDRDVFEVLLQNLMARSTPGPPGYLMIGLHESDPLLPVAAPYALQHYLTRLYLVVWDDGDDFRQQLDGRPVYLELGCL